ncbi:MAG: lytic transglycosylase domain-containing protein [Usitatibacteraceae bacterium]
MLFTVFRSGVQARRSPISWFAEIGAHPFVPLKDFAAVAQSGGQGRSQTGAGTLSLTAASPAAGLCAIGRGRCTKSLLRVAFVLLIVCAFAIHCAAPSQAEARPVGTDQYARYIAAAARRFDIPEHWIRNVMRVESAGDSRAVSRAGAMGLMQIMPATWKELRARHRLGGDPFDPCDNILAGAAYLRELYDRYGSPGFLAAYNAGPGRYEASLAGKPLPRETRDYVAKLAPFSGRRDHAQSVRVAAADQRSWAASPLFTSRSDVVPSSTGERIREIAPAPSANDALAPSQLAGGLFVSRINATERK